MSSDGDTDKAAEAAEAPATDDESKASPESPEAPDSEEKPPDLFDTATDRVIESDVATRKAYQQGRQNLKIKESGPVVTHSKLRDVIGSITNVYATSTTRLDPGPVRAEELEQIRAWYVKVANYEAILEKLRHRHLVLLRGPAGTGRTTTTLHLLDEVTSGRICRLDPEGEVQSLTTDNLDKGFGYLRKLPTPGAAALIQMHLDRLSARLRDKSCWCVLIVERDFSPSPGVAGYLADYDQPDDEKVLRHHLHHVIPDVGLRNNLLARAGSPAMRDAMGPAPGPAEVVRLAGDLAEYGRQTLTEEGLVARCAAGVDQRVADWFNDVRTLPPDKSGDHALRFAAYRIALAVLNRTSAHLVAEAGEKLGSRLIRTSAPLREPGRPVFASEHHWWLEASRGRPVPEDVPFGDTTVPVQLAAFDDDRMPVAVLAHVWRQHHNARTPLLRWLNELASSPQPEVWVRAAQAAGLLCALDFTEAFYGLVNGWAGASDNDPRRRIVAAYALDQSARDVNARNAVREAIAQWKRSDDVARRWTAAAALGRSAGLISVEDSLKDLLALGTWEKNERTPIVHVASDSIARLLALGEIEAVLHRLPGWLDSPRQSVRDVALLAIIKATHIKVDELEDTEYFTSGAGRDRCPLLLGRGKWPLLLALQYEDTKLAEPFADLVWHTLDTARSRNAALKALTSWLRCAEKDQSCLLALDAFLWLLADDPGSRRRLQHLVHGLRAQWEQPLTPDVADHLLKHALADS